jgi:predicted CXXCH cytochrome family protein
MEFALSKTDKVDARFNGGQMKKLFVVLGAVLLVAGLSHAQITGSAHDFSSGFAWNTTGEICVVCHAPHVATGAAQPLWNRLDSSATYTAYGTTLAGSTSGDPAGSSLICLSCHDGTVGLGNFGGTTTNGDVITGTALIGTDLTNDHPISVDYTVANGLNATDTEIATGLPISAVLESNQVQCGSCHNVHNESGEDMLLHATNAASALCLACHNK